MVSVHTKETQSHPASALHSKCSQTCQENEGSQAEAQPESHYYKLLRACSVSQCPLSANKPPEERNQFPSIETPGLEVFIESMVVGHTGSPSCVNEGGSVFVLLTWTWRPLASTYEKMAKPSSDECGCFWWAQKTSTVAFSSLSFTVWRQFLSRDCSYKDELNLPPCLTVG